MTQNTNTTERTTTQTSTDKVRTLQEMLRAEGLNLRDEREWQELADHIEVHKYLINQTIGWTVTWDDAVFSWYDTVYRPMSHAIDRWEIRAAFPGKSDGQLYLAISTHWHFLKKRNPDVTPEEAARDFAALYGQGLARWFSRFLQPAI